MSLTTFERANPPPRRRSCAACIKAKRRCDFALPSCLRCSGRGLECQYPQGIRGTGGGAPPPPRTRGYPPPPSVATPPPPPAATTPATPPPPPPLKSPDPIFSVDALMEEFLGYRDACPTACPTEPFIPSTTSGFTSGFTVSGAFNIGVDVMDEPETMSGFSSGASGPFDSEGSSPEEQHQMVHMSIGMPTPMTTPLGMEPVPWVLAERLDYTLNLLRNVPKILVRDLGLPWLHPAVFQNNMPRCLQDAVACAALYNAKTELTKPFILKTITARCKELSETPIPPSAHDALARLAALGVYHQIALLDGDIEARGAAERTVDALESSATDFLQHVTYDDDAGGDAAPLHAGPQHLPLFPLAETEAFWRSWTFQESARRTVMFSLQFLLVYAMLAGRGQGVCDKAKVCRSWSLAGTLWEARNAVDFAIAWGVRRPIVVTMARMDEVFRAATVADWDSFGRMLLTCYMGTQQARGWYAAQGATLPEF